MIAVVIHPEIRMQGNIPEEFLEITRNYFGKSKVKVTEDTEDEAVDIAGTEWYQKRKNKLTPAVCLKEYRTLHGLTQAKLASLLEVMRHHIAEMEAGRRPISREMAKKMAAFFQVSVERFI